MRVLILFLLFSFSLVHADSIVHVDSIVYADMISLRSEKDIANCNESEKNIHIIVQDLCSDAPPEPSLSSLEKFSKLITLKISYHRTVFFSDYQLFLNEFLNMPSLPELSEFDLSEIRLLFDQEQFDLYLEKISQYPHLKKLKLGELGKRSLKLPRISFDKISLISSLEDLDLSSVSCGHLAIGLPAIDLLPNLKVLNLSHNYLVSTLETYFIHPLLENIDLTYSFIYSSTKSKPINLFPTCKNLTTLNLSYAQMPLESLDFSNVAPELQVLIMDGVKNLATMRFDSIGQNSKLRSFSMSEIVLSAENLEQAQWTTLPHLESLNLMGSSIKGLCFSSLVPNLVHLNLAFSNVSPKDLQAISKLSNLVDIDLTNTKISKGAIKSLSQLKCLKRIVLVNTQLSGANFEQLATLPQLEVLDLSGANIAVEDLKKLSSLQQVKEIRLLDMQNKNLSIFIDELVQQMPNTQIVH